jgi:hypothetical protein
VQIASDEIVITMTREELKSLNRALSDAFTYWERTCPDEDDDDPNIDAAEAFNELSLFWQRVTNKELQR